MKSKSKIFNRQSTVKDFCPFKYGKSLPERNRHSDGVVPVYGSGGIVGYHDVALTTGSTIIIGRKGTIGSVYFSEVPCWPIDTTFYVSELDEIDLKFAYYLLKTLDLEQKNSDSAVPGLNRDVSHEIQLTLPFKQERKNIVNHLWSVTKKIILLESQNNILEKILQEIFNSWFIDFDGQTEFVDSELGQIPKGWYCSTLNELKSKEKNSISTGPFGSSLKVSEYVPTGIPLIRGKNFKNGFISEDDFVFVSEIKSTQLKTSNVFFNDVLIVTHGNIGNVGIILENSTFQKYVMSANMMKFSNDSSKIINSYVYYYLKSILGQDELIGNTTTTGVPHIAQPTQTLKKVRIIVPPLPLLKEFDILFSSFSQKIKSNLDLIRQLSKIQDSLMPQLMSGELVN